VNGTDAGLSPVDSFEKILGPLFYREVVKTTILELDPPNHKIVGGVCLHPLA